MSESHTGLTPLPMARLSCGHYQRVTVPDARSHAVVLCLTCHQQQRPDVVLVREWHAVCNSCKWHRWCGQLKWEARKAKNRHTVGDRYAHHVRTVYATIPGMEYTQLSSSDSPTPPSDESENDDGSDRPHLF